MKEMKEHLLLCRLSCSILLLSALTCKTIAYSTSNATLPQEEVDAINALFGQFPRTSQLDGGSKFSASDCNNRFTNLVGCDCYNATCRVTGLYLSSVGLKGEIPKEIGKLTSLDTLSLAHSKFSKIPSSLQNLSKLSNILLDDNFLGGHIPTFFGQMKSLTFLSLSDNNFDGPIPPELGALLSLRVLNLAGNLLSGQIPSQLGSLSDLTNLDLSDNKLLGELPVELGHLTNLQFLSLRNNNFSGNFLQSFDQLKNMTYFDIRGNNFNGQIPAFIAQGKNIRELYLMGNNFEWPVSHEVFQSLTNLEILQLADITGSPRDFPIVNNQSLTHLTLRNCSLGGQIPAFIWQSQSLQYLDLSFNNLVGELPAFASNPKYIYLRGNKLQNSSLRWFADISNSFVSESSREHNTQSSDNHFISETSRVSRGKAFTIIEDETLCRSWLAVSQDPITGNSQTMTVFWERVLVNFNSQFNGESNRNRISLSHRWSAMQKAINKFCGFLEQVQLRQQSGTTEADMVAEAKRMYHALQKKHFTFDTCWDILRRSCKWDEFRTQSKKSTQHAYPCSNPPTGESDAFQSNQNTVVHEQPCTPSTRPIGTKAAKEKLKNQTSHDSRFDEMAANQSKIVGVLSTISARTIERDEQKAIDREQKAADRRRRAEDREQQLKLLSMMNEREQRNEDHKIMSMDMTNLNPMQRAYYEDLQRQILFRTTNRNT